MLQLLDHKGNPFQNRKEAPPPTGPSFGRWAGDDHTFKALPGGGMVQFDLSKLTVSDFRQMTDHYQINSSLSVLSFMQHQSDWSIECEDPKIAAHCEENLRGAWTTLNRGLSQANWAGYSPNVIDWENSLDSRSVILDKFRDLPPEECRVVWKEVDGWAPPGTKAKPKIKVYDGFKQLGWAYPIPPDNSLWYPILMQNGDYSGRKLLRPAFTSWYFSLLLHLFANRYYERFGEPTPVGRAPFDDEITVDNTVKPGNQYMLEMLADLRSRSVVVLPNDSTADANGRRQFDYEIEYLESQMRGADFERYMTRLDEEMSIGVFTPILLMRTADVGSYNLGVGHMQVYLWMMNAMNDDRALYINKYILDRMVNFNFSVRAPRARIKFRKLGNANAEMLATILQALIQNGQVGVDLDELGQMLGMTLTAVRQTTAPPAPPADPAAPPAPEESGGGDGTAAGVTTEIITRLLGQVKAAWRDERVSDLSVKLGYKKKMRDALILAGNMDGADSLDYRFNTIEHVLNVAVKYANLETEAEMCEYFERVVRAELKGLT